MAESIQHFALKTIGLSHCNGRKPCTLLEAARHNLREIQAELGANGHINPRRMAHNVTLAGPATAAEVYANAADLLALVDTSKLKRDHVQAIEAVFSLPSGTVINPMAYFGRCLEWVREALPMPVLLATAHHDEAAPHLHVLMLPLKDGKHVGGALIDKAKLRTVRESFFTQVAGPAGLKRDGAKVRGMVKQWAVAAVLARCEGLALPAAMGPLWPVWVAAIERDPTAAMLALEIDANALRPAGERPPSSPIALQKQAQKNQGLSCVALHQHTTPASAPKAAPDAVAEPAIQPPAIDSLGALWTAVGCRSNWTTPSKAERLRRARDAQQRAIERHRPQPAAAAPAGAAHQRHQHPDGLTREHDEHAHDLSAWND
jgi:hypothetical protein